MVSMTVTHTHTPTTIEDRCMRLDLSMARVARRAEVSYRHLVEGRLSGEELARVEKYLTNVERGAYLAPAEVLSEDPDGTIRLGGLTISEL
jgi:hypothetical protein